MRAGRGMSLVEMMVGLALGLFLIVALVALFDSNSEIRRHVDQAAQQIENGRYALDLLRDDLHLAGYYGNAVPWRGYATAAATVPDVCATTAAGIQFASSPSKWPVPVFGIAAGDATPSCVTGPGRKAGTDILVVRRASTIPTPAGALESGSLYVQASGCNSEGQQHKDFVFDKGANASTFGLRKNGCAVAADIYEFETHVYYVSNETIPTLRLLTISGTTAANEPLVEGIDDLRVEYGRDGSGDGTPEEFRKCLSTVDPCSAVDWADTVAVRVHLLARSLDGLGGHVDTKTYTLGTGAVVGPFNDPYKRHAYSSVVRLMNPAGRREL
jgi:type IV pilus assembly protein PilW